MSEINSFSCNFTSDNATEYLKNTSLMFAKNSFLYTVQNIFILSESVLDRIPELWVKALIAVPDTELHKILFGYIEEIWPDDLKHFIGQCFKLGQHRFPNSFYPVSEDNYTNLNKIHLSQEKTAKTKPSQRHNSKTSLKKQLEIKTLSHVINEICQDLQCNVVLDIGSGLGYLDEELHSKFRINSIGIDSSETYTCTAIDRLQNNPCSQAMAHYTLKIDNSEKCLNELRNILQAKHMYTCPCSHQSSNGFAPGVMIGLHSCGHLMQYMMKIFCQIGQLKAFVCVGCCYNKIDFNAFPMSQAAKLALSETQKSFPGWTPCVHGMRIASHGTRSHFQKDCLTTFGLKCMFYRAVFQLFLDDAKLDWSQPKRHLREADVSDFETYCRAMLKNQSDILERSLGTLKNLYSLNEHLFPRVKILLLLQQLLQPLLEMYVYVDRKLYFEEKGITAEIVALWDDAKSSRNLGLIARKG